MLLAPLTRFVLRLMGFFWVRAMTEDEVDVVLLMQVGESDSKSEVSKDSEVSQLLSELEEASDSEFSNDVVDVVLFWRVEARTSPLMKKP